MAGWQAKPSLSPERRGRLQQEQELPRKNEKQEHQGLEYPDKVQEQL